MRARPSLGPRPNQPQLGLLSVSRYTCWVKGLGTRLGGTGSVDLLSVQFANTTLRRFASRTSGSNL